VSWLNKLTTPFIRHSPIQNTVWIGLLPVLFLGIFFFYPLGMIFKVIIVQAVEHGFPVTLWTRLGSVLWFTIWQAVLSTLLTLVVGLPASYLFGKYQFAGRKALRALLTVPFILPTVVVAVGFNALIGPHGWINNGLMAGLQINTPPIQILNSIWAILLAHVFYNTVVVLRVVGNGWARVDQRLEQAGASLGASPLSVFWHITLPLVKPYIYSAVLLVFLFDFTSFGVILMLGGARLSTLEVEIYIQAVNLLNLPAAGLMSAVQLLFTAVITGVYSWTDRRMDQSGKIHYSELKLVRSWKEKAGVWGGAAVLSLFLLSPLMALALGSVSRLEADRGERGGYQTGFTLDYYQELFINRRNAYFYVPPIQAAANSLSYAAVTVLLAVPLGLATTYAIKRQKGLVRWVEMASMLPLGASAVTLGLGFLLVFNHPPLDVQHFPWLIPIAHSLVAFPFVVRVIYPAWISIPSSYQAAAAALGASPFRTWMEIEFPLLLRPIMVAVLFSFTISLGEFGATSFLAVPERPTLPVAIYRYLAQPGALNYGQALAMATLLMMVCGIIIIFIESIQPPDQSEVI
jgi:thiamine transport system permease protein